MDEESNAASDRSAMLASANASVTGAGSTMGTPAYMSPEQADDATSVDHRADIYSLGCTFYALLTGTPPFQGASAVEVVSKHRTERLQRPDSIVASVPKTLGDIVDRMTAKSPTDRFQDMSEVIAALETFLNQQQAKQPLLTDPKLVAELEAACASFNQNGLAKAKQWIPMGFVATCIVLSALTSIFHWRFGIAIGMLGVATLVSHLVMAIFSAYQDPIAKRLRSLIWLSPWTDWITWIIGIAVMVLVIWALGLLVYATGAIIGGIVLAFAYEAMVDKTSRARRTASIDASEQIMKRLRLGGINEPEIHGFVARFAGRQWEEYFCALFDYDVMRSVRQQLIASGQNVGKARFRPWRDGIVDRLDAMLNERRSEKDQKLLTRIEQASLTSQGFSIDVAKQQAEQMAQALVSFANQTRHGDDVTIDDTNRESVEQKRAKFKAMMAEARSGKFSKQESFSRRATQSLLNHLFGGKYRFVLGSILLIGSILWAKQNGLLEAATIDSLRSTATSVNDSLAGSLSGRTVLGDTSQVSSALQQLGSSNVLTKETEPFLGVFTNLGQAVIGFVIVVMSLMAGWRVSIAATIGAGLALIGPMMLPALPFLSATVVAFIASLVVLIVGGYLLRVKESYSS